MSKDNKISVSELVHLEIPLLAVELHYYGETIKDIPWSDEEFTVYPYVFYERKNNQVYIYYNPKGIEWKTKKAGQFNEETLIKKVESRWDKISEILETEKALNKKEFKQFIKSIKDIWVWLDCMWWMIEHYDQNNMDMNDLISLRKETEYFAPGLFAVVRKSLKKIYPEKKKFSDVIKLEEFLSDDLPSDNMLKDRLNEYGYADGKLFDSFSVVKDKFNIEIEKKKVDKNNLKGQVAYKGKVKGIVRIVNGREDMKKVNKGDVLVASTTTPDFLPAMKRSGAIISEHGGAICHAAITSRELRIPCVVGVQGATEVLNDGDRVEVDAENGIVNILDKK